MGNSASEMSTVPTLFLSERDTGARDKLTCECRLCVICVAAGKILQNDALELSNDYEVSKSTRRPGRYSRKAGGLNRSMQTL
jgi:hypothetical protein